MRLDIPFFKQIGTADCGPIALKRVLSYFGRDEKLQTLKEKTGIKEGQALHTIQIATAAASLGYRTDFYSKNLLFNEEHMKLDFYQKYANDVNLESSKKFVEEARKVGVNVQERMFSLEKLLELVTEDNIPIALIDWNIIKSRKEKGYQGHFAPILGYDDKSVYLHNEDSGEVFSVQRSVFDEARKADGTDEDVVVVYRQ